MVNGGPVPQYVSRINSLLYYTRLLFDILDVCLYLDKVVLSEAMF